MRPVFTWTLPEYSLKAAAFVRNLSKSIFKRLGAQDCTQYDPSDYGYVPTTAKGTQIVVEITLPALM